MSSAHCSDKEKYGFSVDKSKQSDNKVCNGGLDETWYKEVIALRKKAGEYKVNHFNNFHINQPPLKARTRSIQENSVLNS